MSLSERLAADWYAPRLTALTLVLTPLASLFALGVAARRALYRTHILRPQRLPVPVIVVGNVSVGGSGKTPLVAALCAALRRNGYRPGIVSRGYGGLRATDAPLVVTERTDVKLSGDEPALLARAGFPVAVAADRVAAGRALLAAHPECDVIVADDGLQHYALERDVEIAVVDAARGFGNGWRLPAGPLREPARRLDSVDAVVVQGDAADVRLALPQAFAMTLSGSTFRGVADPSRVVPLLNSPAAACTRSPESEIPIGSSPRWPGWESTPCVMRFPTIIAIVAADLAFPGARAVLMTEKDAVKCTGFADARCWYLPVAAEVDPALVARVLEKLRGPQAA